MTRNDLFRLSATHRRDPAVDSWLKEHADPLGQMARRWFECLRQCGDDVREALHDGCPTACIGDAAFAYVSVFKHHVNVGFFRGTDLADPEKLLEGTGKRMRHVKLRPDHPERTEALRRLIEGAHNDMRARVKPRP